jgi:hypothetical protein
MNPLAREVEHFKLRPFLAVACQALGLVLAGVLLGIAPEAARLLSGGNKGLAFIVISLLTCASFLMKGTVARVAHTSPLSSKVCSFWAGGALLAMSLVSLVVPPVEYRSHLTIQMMLGLLLVVFPFANLMEERKPRPGA